jgi:hypothetical protein
MSPTDRPIARTGGLATNAAGDEVLVYDLERHRAHRLNAVAATVWRHCDGSRDVAAIAAVLRGSGGPSMTVEVVRYALAELGRARLLRAPVAGTALTRRELVQRVGRAAAVALPLVASITVPTAAQAQSVLCLPPSDTGLGVDCTSDEDCCGPGVCLGASTQASRCCVPTNQNLPCQDDDECCGSFGEGQAVCDAGVCIAPP